MIPHIPNSSVGLHISYISPNITVSTVHRTDIVLWKRNISASSSIRRCMPLLVVRLFAVPQEKGADPGAQGIGGAISVTRGDTAGVLPMDRNQGLERG